MNHAKAVSLLVLLLAASFGAPAWADTPARQVAVGQAGASVRESLGEAARAKFDEGFALYGAGRHAEAREAFLAAHELGRDPRVLYNVAVCDKALGQNARAIATLERSVASPAAPLPADYVKRVAETIATLERLVGGLVVDVTPSSAKVAVDGEPVEPESGATPRSPVRLDAGVRQVTATADGFEPAAASVVVKAGAVARVSLALVPASGAPAGPPAPPARLRVTTDDADDVVAIDGARVGRSGVEVPIPAGEHRVVVSRANGATRSFDLLLRASETRDLRVSVEERKGISPLWFVGGGVVLAAAVTTAAILFANRGTRFEGQSAGTIDPFVVSASFRGGAR